MIEFLLKGVGDSSQPPPRGADVETALLRALRDHDGHLRRLHCAQLLAAGRSRAESLVEVAVQCISPGHPDAPGVARRVVDQVSGSDLLLTGAEVVAGVLAAHSVESVFAYPGTSELAVCDAISASVDVRLINGRGDKESAFMAAGASLLRPNRAAAVLHGARGLTNAGGGLAESRRNEAGTMFVVGLPSTGSRRFLPPHGESGLVEAMGMFAGWGWEAPPVPTDDPGRLELAARFLRRLHEGLTVAAEPPFQPSLFGLPQDVAEARWLPLSTLAAFEPIESRPSMPASVDAAAAVLRSSRRPVLLLDDYALRYDGVRESLQRLSTLIGAPVVQLRYRRGPMLFERLQPAEVTNFAGWLNQFSDAHRTMLRDCDLLVTVEDRNLYRRVVGDLPECRKVAINSDPMKVVKNEYLRPGDLMVIGEPARILSALADRLAETISPRPGWFPATVRETSMLNPEAPSQRVAEGRRSLAQALARTLARWERPVLVDDSQMFGGLLAESYDDLPVGLRVFGGHGGFVGGGLATAVGLAVGNPDVRVMCTLGDQGFTNAIQGLVAAVQERARVLFVVCNNGESVSLNKQARSSLGTTDRAYLSNVAAFGYRELVDAMGLPATRLMVPIGADREVFNAAINEVDKALADAASADGPALVELVLPADPEVWRGIWISQGFEQMTTAGASLP